MEELKQLYNEYIASYDSLNIIDKKKELLKKVSDLNSNLIELTEALGRKQNEFTGKINIDDNELIQSDDAFLTTMFIYTNAIDNAIGNLLNQLVEDK